MNKLAIILLIFGISNVHASNDGSICLGKNESKLAVEHGKNLYITVNNEQKYYFTKSYVKPKLIKSSLPTDKVHQVSIFINNKVVKKLHVNFISLKSKQVTIWRSAGGWQLLTGLSCGI